MEEYKVRLPVFEGPLDLLLHLVKINEMEINEIPISEITRQYLDYLRLMESFDLEIAGDYLVMASTLISIKLRALLPDDALEPEEESEGESEYDITTARALMDQLIQYRKFKEAAFFLREKEMQQTRTFFREVALPRLADAEQDEELRIDLEKMLDAFRRVLRFVQSKGTHMVHGEEFTVEEKIDWVERKLSLGEPLALDALFSECGSKIEMIVVLLALLELTRQKSVSLRQDDPYGPLTITRKEAGAGNDAARDVRADEAGDSPSARIIDIGSPGDPASAADDPESDD